MSDADPLVALEALLPALPAAIDARRMGGELGKASLSLRNADRQIERIEALFDLATLIGFGDGPQGAFVSELRDAACETGEALQEAETPAALEKAIAGYDRDLSTHLSALDRSIGQHWRTVTARKFESLVAVGNLLGRINADSDLGRRLAACGTGARNVPEGMGGRPLLDRVTQLMEERKQLEARRREELGEGEVADFVNALSENRATLEMVTGTVRDWLEEHHAVDKLKVVAA